MEIVNLTTGQTLADQARVAGSFLTRLKGLLGTKSLATGVGLVIKPCNSVHTFGMNYAIDVVFAGADNKVIKTVAGLAPGRMAACSGSRYVIELPAGTVAETGTEPGDTLVLR